MPFGEPNGSGGTSPGTCECRVNNSTRNPASTTTAHGTMCQSWAATWRPIPSVSTTLASVQVTNPYFYAGGDPMHKSDPFGLTAPPPPIPENYSKTCYWDAGGGDGHSWLFKRVYTAAGDLAGPDKKLHIDDGPPKSFCLKFNTPEENIGLPDMPCQLGIALLAHSPVRIIKHPACRIYGADWGSGETVTLYRGVDSLSPGYASALDGVAAPIGGDATALEHVLGNTDSEFTSWTSDFGLAEQYATQQSGTGIVLEQTFPKSSVTSIPASTTTFGESESLVRGCVSGCSVIKVPAW